MCERLFDWLSVSEAPASADAIFVLAGRQSRKLYALDLLRQGAAPTLVLSVARFEIRRFSELPLPASIDLLQIASGTQPRLRHYFVTLQAGRAQAELMPRGRLGTLSEIGALARWLEVQPQVASLLVVSNAFHLRRVRACCRRLLPEGLRISYVAIPECAPLTRDSWWREPRVRTIVLKEFPKLALYRALLAARAVLRL